MFQKHDEENLRQRALSFNAALFLLIAYGLSALIALWLGDWMKAVGISGGSTIITLLIGFSKHYNQPVHTTNEGALAEPPKSILNSHDPKEP
jgi:preprotein translocase subunit SecY